MHRVSCCRFSLSPETHGENPSGCPFKQAITVISPIVTEGLSRIAFRPLPVKVNPSATEIGVF
jgi:hypothetical protein